MNRAFYSFLLYISLPLFLLRLLWRSRRFPAYRQRFSERLGLKKLKLQKESLWIHAVSLGEVNAATPLVKSLQKKEPNKTILLTTITPSGSARVKEVFGDSVHHVYLPYDLPGMTKRFIRQTKAKKLIVMETEIWPNLYHYCQKMSVPLIVANGRLSKKSFDGYTKIKKLVSAALKNVTLLFAQTKEDAARFIGLGAKAERVIISGNIKYDMTPPENLNEKVEQFKKLLPNDRPIWLAASTHEGEEKIILDAFKDVKEKINHSVLVLVPRHPDRFKIVTQLCIDEGFKVQCRSTNEACQSNTDVFIGDSLGELLAFYQICHVALVGGSLMEIGGHNLLEPAMFGKPILTGPHTFNFAQISETFLSEQACMVVKDKHELSQAIIDLIKHPEKAKALGARAENVFQANSGSLEKHLEGIFSE